MLYHYIVSCRILVYHIETSIKVIFCLISDPLNNVQVAAGSPVPMPQVALGLIPTHNIAPPQSVSSEEIHRQFQKKLEELEQQVRGQNSKCGFPLAEEQKKRKTGVFLTRLGVWVLVCRVV